MKLVSPQENAWSVSHFCVGGGSSDSYVFGTLKILCFVPLHFCQTSSNVASKCLWNGIYLTLLFIKNAHSAGVVCLIVTKPWAKFLFSWELYLELQAALSQKRETFLSAWSGKRWGLCVLRSLLRAGLRLSCPTATSSRPASRVGSVIRRCWSCPRELGNSLTLQMWGQITQHLAPSLPGKWSSPVSADLMQSPFFWAFLADVGG